ncbi:adult-specific cuticular protein ACP-20-like [Euwallacea similis]|uniref:adult-specific cuticular protein ACP-20-like n=1 Tax=Euwallacea similis TaxID=1736056 RepID=UPI00344CE5DB
MYSKICILLVAIVAKTAHGGLSYVSGGLGLGLGGLGLGGGLVGLGGGLGSGLGLGLSKIQPLAVATPTISLAATPLALGTGSIGLGGLGGIGKSVDYYTVPKYEYKYAVGDPKTGDQKEQSEERLGDVVRGEYSLAEPDGTIRVVKYTADKVNGFNAHVSRIGKAIHPEKTYITGGLGLGLGL